MPKFKPKAELIHTIVCEDIRREDNNKLILLGVYADGIMIHELPGLIVISLWLQFKVHISEPIKIEVKFSGDALEQEVVVPAEFKHEKLMDKVDSVAPLILGGIPLRIKKQGRLLISYKTSIASSWEVAREVNIEHGPPIS